MDGEGNTIIVTKPVKCATRDQPWGKVTVLVCGHKVLRHPPRGITLISYAEYSSYSCYSYHTSGTSQCPAMVHCNSGLWHTVSAYKGYVTQGLHVFILLGFTLKLFTNNENHHPVPSCTYTHTHTHTHACTHTHTHTRMHAHTHTQTVAYTHTHTHTLENILIPTHSETERPRVPVQNQQTKELISAWKMLHKLNNKDLSCIW